MKARKKEGGRNEVDKGGRRWRRGRIEEDDDFFARWAVVL